MGYTPLQLRYAINHIFLPPKLPQENDQRGEHDAAISSLCLDASKPFRQRLDQESNVKWDSMALLIRAQNSGIILRRDWGDGIDEKISYECFEVTPPASDVMSTKGKLVMSFPGPAIQFPAETFDSKYFQNEFAAFLAEMNNAVIEEDDDEDSEDEGRRRKSGLSAAHPGETQDPVFITSLLTGIMLGLGGRGENVTRINKRVADDVLLKGSDKTPWRRSALWLVLRVAIQTTLLREDPTSQLYKQFMVFLHGFVLSLALREKFDSDILFTMRAKTCRRLAKLGDDVPEFLVNYTNDVSERVGDELQRRWTEIQQLEIKPLSVLDSPWAPDQLNVAADTTLRLTNSTARISLALGNSSMNLAAISYDPHETNRLRNTSHFGDLTASKLEAAFQADPHVNLADFEFLVGRGSLASWLERRIAPGATSRAQESATNLLFGCMRRYEKFASPYYRDNPEDLSLMVLTMFELWVAIDKIAVAACPLLGNYSPEVPIDRSLTTSNAALLRPLLLRKSIDLQRLLAVDEYVRLRHRNATYRDASVFSESISSSSFAVKYFNQDATRELRNLKAQIERDAQEIRDGIRRDLETKTREHDRIYARLVKEVHDHTEESRITHTTITGKRKKRYNISYTYDCEKCQLQTQLDGFSVPVHEWPLPEDDDHAKRVVFELRLPRTFAQWRAATALLLWDVCTPIDKRNEFDQSRPSVILNSSKDLSGYLRPGDDELQIMTLASASGSSKMFGSKKLPVTQEEIFLPSGMKWRLYEPRSRVWVRGSSPTSGVNGNMFREADTTQKATLPISSNPSSIYLKAQLQYAVSATRHTSNQIIASQDLCPPQLSLHEYMSFASLRSGARIQWISLLRELREGALSWQTEEVGTLVSMLMWQVGCIIEEEGTRELEWHVDLKDLEFGQALLREMGTLLRRVKGNWKEVVTVRTIILLTSRLLASTRHVEVKELGYALMRECREVTWEWVGQLEEKLQDCGEDFVKEFQGKVCEMACTCRATYDVDDDSDEQGMDAVNGSHLDALLSSEEDVSIFVACSIIVHDNKPNNLSGKTVSREMKRLLERDRRLAHAVKPVLHKLFLLPVDGNVAADFGQVGLATVAKKGFNAALKRIWPVYTPADWFALAEPNDRWITCETAGGGTSRGVQSQEVHLDILNGKLLINGKPLGRLPADFVKHPTYVRVFGERKVLDVVPADMPGMQFATQSLVSGYQVSFGMRGENDLVIRSKRENKIFELIPHESFTGDLPQRFVEDNLHWLDLSNGQIELRSLQAMWDSLPSNWIINFSDPRRSCSNGARMVSATLAPFESSQFLTVTCEADLDPSTLSVDLPRYRLSFFRNGNDQLQCVNFPGMIIDHEDQSIGAFVGLENRLVLKGDDTAPAGVHRKVLVPFGEVRVSPYEENHVKVSIETKEDRDVRCAKYTVNSSLGCLTGNLSLKSRLYQIYLQALTSHCLPDPLTKHTGTEEALLEFNSAACLSFRELGEEEMGFLIKIAKLTPNRFGTPQHNPKAQSVTWTNLPPLSHHCGFAVRAAEVMVAVKRLQVFAEPDHATKEDKKNTLPAGNSLLDARSTLRTSMFYPTDIKSPKRDVSQDQVYSSRDADLIREKLVCSVASNIHSGHSCLLLPKTPSLPQLFQSKWTKVRAPLENFRLSYNRSWLNVNMSEIWLSVFEKCRSLTSKEAKKSQLLFSLSAMVFKNEDYAKFVPAIIVAFSDNRLLRPTLPVASGHYFDFSSGTAPTLEKILVKVKDGALPGERTALWEIPMNHLETDEEFRRRRDSQYKRRVKQASLRFANFFFERWNLWMQGTQTLGFPNVEDKNLFRNAEVLEKVSQYFRHCNQNRLLLKHAQGVQEVLDENFQDAVSWDVIEYSFDPCLVPSKPSDSFGALSPLLERVAPAITRRDEQLWPGECVEEFRAPAESSQSTKLSGLLAEMKRSTIRIRQRYAEDLHESMRKLNSLPSLPSGPTIPFGIEELDQHRTVCQDRLATSLEAIEAALAPISVSENAIASAGLWPRITLRALLRRLAYPVNATLSPEWREVLLYLARDILEYQRSVRLLAYAQQNKREDFFREVDTHIYDVDSITANPDWTLIQIEGNFLARPLQIKVAQEMITPSSNANTVLQLNMGEGKTSAIVPMAAASLADAKKVVRVVVLKPLAGQMFQLLVERLAGLCNHRIFYMPFSRKIRVGKEEIALIQRNYEVCMKEGGIWVVQPEHILSFKLMSIDRYLASNNEADHLAAESLGQSQRWLDSHSRDILDESDEILHIRYQLVYTVGNQQPLELHPDRWTIAEELFTFVSKHLDDVKTRNRTGIDVQSSIAGSFAPVRILDIKSGRDLVEEVIEDIFAGRLSSFNVRFLPESMQTLARQFISEPKVEETDVDQLRQYCGGGNDWKHLLLLRGLIAHGILVYALKERQYRVDYGLDLSRSLLAVPYWAKDVPSLRAEFGHPDVCLVLTCLTYYYEGLSSAQLKLCFDLLFKLDNPPLEYEMWIGGDSSSVPVHLRTLNGINTDDADQHTTHIIPLFSKRKTVVDFYLSHVVFPKAAKEFPYKLSSSGWDLAEVKPGGHHVTGFSGTNDNRFLLPTSISQQDPLGQMATSAKVLTHVLQKENNHYRCAAQEDGGHLTVKSFLQFLTQETLQSPVQVLLDVGAQMLDLKNDALAREWLKLRPDMAAAIFFNDNDDMMVVSQDGTRELLISSPFKGQLDRCLVYLDDAHTRGVDLRLPIQSRAAVTLGPKVTKDRLIQGCMQIAIRDLRKGSSRSANVHTVDVLRWAIYETCKDITHHVPHWAEQGWDYLRRRKAWEEFNQTAMEAQVADSVVNPDIDTLQKVWMREEARSLEKMYGCQSGPASTGLGGGDLNMRASIFATPELKERLDLLGVKELKEVNVDEEQEREVSHEIEKETHIERPPKVEPAKHQLSEGLKQFISKGVLPMENPNEFRKSFIPMFRSIEGTVKKSPLNGEDVWSPGLYVTIDFATTITAKDNAERGSSDYLRPLNWVLTSRRYIHNNVVVGISAFEANTLLPQLRKDNKVSLHVYAPRVTKDMLPLDDLKFYSISKLAMDNWVVPRTNIISQLNLFAGQLYLANYDTYLQLCQFLGLHSGEGRVEPMEVDDEPYPIQSDGFVCPGRHREVLGLTVCRFVESPIPFFQELIGLRRKGTGYLPTHLGRVVHGRLLKQDDFDY
ncbi:hypothetical protein BT96DRAFT_1059147 [Gymnopus androsaceus JB14]|uniref:ubiquitinyl hydrolase 1 n=1 Tax=Gymnopus androsaceus JB14 TaxID=1447944 RepID=A0A6A4H3L6_9AGAR|nr:hypothetical protein BT96DRAFT_1059147 [Gymnopus androsaceus JB14]